jgi:hypothetical protein
LQVLLSQVHRLRALELLGKFLDLGPWAVNLALSVGIFPYVLKLLQGAKELRPLLVFIWAKILAVDIVSESVQLKDLLIHLVFCSTNKNTPHNFCSFSRFRRVRWTWFEITDTSISCQFYKTPLCG